MNLRTKLRWILSSENSSEKGEFVHCLKFKEQQLYSIFARYEKKIWITIGV